MTRLRTLAAGLTLALAVPAVGQLRPPPGPGPGRPPVVLRTPGGVPAVATPFYQSNVGHWAGQVANELELLRAELRRGGVPFPASVGLLREADQAVRAANDFQRLAATTADRGRLYRADEAMDAAVDRLVAAVNRAGVSAVGVTQAVARAKYADQRLHDALAQDDPNPDVGRRRVARLAEAVEEQAEELRQAAAEGPAADRQLDRSLRTFALGADRLGDEVKAGGPVPQAARGYADLSRRWQGIVTALGARPGATVRYQMARVDGLFRRLGEGIAAAGGGGLVPPPPVPDPGGGSPGFINAGSLIAVGAGEGGGPRLRVFSDIRGGPSFDLYAYDANFRGGVRVAVADLTGDGHPDVITGPGRGMPPIVRVFDGRDLSLLTEFQPFDPTWAGGVFVAAADRSRDGRSLVVVSVDAGGGPHVKAFDLANGRETDSFFAYADGFRGGVRVALGDVDGDGVPDLVTAPGPDHDPLVRVYRGTDRQVIREIYAFDRAWTGGLFVATADVTRNGRADVIVGADAGGQPWARVFEATRGRMLGEIDVYHRRFAGGVRVASQDVNADGVPDIVCAPGPGSAAPVRVFSGRDRTPLAEFPAFEPTWTGGVYVGSR